MLGKTNVGGSKKAFAIIGVTYPAGSVCTCTDGMKTLTLKDTSGLGIFLIPYAATWTVSCTDGDKTKSVTVSVAAEGQSESVTLTYEFMLFNNGSYASETGGWTDIHNNTLYKSVYGPSEYEDTIGWLSTINSVDLSDYLTLYFVVSSYNSANGLTIGVSPTKEGAYDFSASYEFNNWQNSSTETIYSINISSVSSGYIKARLVGYNGNTASIRIKKVYAV